MTVALGHAAPARRRRLGPGALLAALAACLVAAVIVALGVGPFAIAPARIAAIRPRGDATSSPVTR